MKLTRVARYIQADYLQIKTLLEETGLPYAVTPGGEDCMEAFEDIFGLEPSARLLRSRGGEVIIEQHLL